MDAAACTPLPFAPIRRSQRTAIVGARVLLPGGPLETGIIIEDGRIAGIGTGIVDAVEQDAENLLLVPGIVDLHGDADEWVTAIQAPSQGKNTMGRIGFADRMGKMLRGHLVRPPMAGIRSCGSLFRTSFPIVFLPLGC